MLLKKIDSLFRSFGQVDKTFQETKSIMVFSLLRAFARLWNELGTGRTSVLILVYCEGLLAPPV